jgi:glycosyltransferase involved in cell wall biosynthesis
MTVSIIVPVYNECENIRHLHKQVCAALAGWEREWELVLVDDGSTDGGHLTMQELVAEDSRVKIIRLRRNFGQSAAMHAGMQLAEGEVIVTMDGDLQNDPADIPAMVAKLEDGYDLVHGWRKDRQDKLITRKIPSWIANRLISWVAEFPIHDLGCTLKAMRREIAREIELYGEMHRFIPILAHARGARCVEVVTRHHPRRFGQTKYGLGRTTRVLLDLITVKYMLAWFASPMKLFGRIGLACSLLMLAAGIAATVMKLGYGVDLTGNPLTLLSVVSALAGIQFFSLGLLGEVCARIYYASQPKQNFAVRELVNFESQRALRKAA